jgi:hypothetical protein
MTPATPPPPSPRHPPRAGNRLPGILPALVGLGLLIAALLTIQQLRWSHQFGDIVRTEAFAVGPIDPGSAVEQSFVSPTEFLTGLTVAVRLKQEDWETKSLIFRLRDPADGGELIREGRVDLTYTPGAGTETARWSFAPIHQRRGDRFDVQISLDPAATVPIEFPVSQGDRIEGVLRTNGIPTDQQFDLLLAPTREAAGFNVLRVVLRDGMLLLTLAVLVPTLWIVALLALIRYVPAVGSLQIGRLSTRSAAPAVPGLVALTVTIVLATFAGGREPERDPVFWILCLFSGSLAISVPALAFAAPNRLARLARAAPARSRRWRAAASRGGRSARPAGWRRRVRAPRFLARSTRTAASLRRRVAGQTLGRLPTRLRGPANLLLRITLLAALVISAQIGLVRTYEDRNFPEKTVLDRQLEDGFDVLYLGDSSVFYADKDDTDMRFIDQMLDTMLPQQDVVSVAEEAFHMGVYLDFLGYLDRRQKIPPTVVIPVHPGTFYGDWLIGFPFDRQRIVLRFSGTPGESFARAWLVFSEFDDSLDHAREYVATSAGATEYDPLRPDNPRLRQAVAIADLLAARGVRIIFYVIPINISPANSDLDPELRRATRANIATIESALEAAGAIVLDLAGDLEPGYFSQPDMLFNGHLDAGGRAYIAGRLAAAIRANGRPQ